MDILQREWFKVAVLVVLVVFGYMFWFYFITVPKEKAIIKLTADSVLQKCLADADKQEALISTPVAELRKTEQLSVDQMRASCQNDYQSHVDQGYSQI